MGKGGSTTQALTTARGTHMEYVLGKLERVRVRVYRRTDTKALQCDMN